ncbi:MAG: hypothetical protein AMJ93_15955 [Anaerolineae bacterium SM23_84]|nr:MAG: hypothetical protein AMJ93_15955 [Anaerolineae bacterium SM23_84]
MSKISGDEGATTYPPGVPVDLGDGLLLKAVRNVQDAQRLAAFNAFVHQDTAVGVWTHWRLGGRHPAVTFPDSLFVEDTNKGEIVSTLGLMTQTWTYDGIPLPVGQVELVGTHPDYRGRGLIRAQMEVTERMLRARRASPTSTGSLATSTRYPWAVVLTCRWTGSPLWPKGKRSQWPSSG